MKKKLAFFLSALAIASCSKHDPILPGVRNDIFDANEVVVQGKEVPDLPDSVTNISGDKDCEYKQDVQNVIWSGDKKIWSGFSTNNAVKSNQSPICDGKFIYTGLSTGEVIKINTATKKTVWTTGGTC